ncbi:MAG: NDP-hexose 2,3-dehydratase family protein [Actinomycetota bacterium]|nr:NDP-hexose 2,3-dehydratase family protein [Actinomycetota bacterium]
MTTTRRVRLRRPDGSVTERLEVSARATAGRHTLAEIRAWIVERGARHNQTVRRVPFAELDRWSFAPDTGDLRHDTGGFFQVQGIRVVSDFGPVRQWQQPIINQPEVGVLGILAREFDGILHFLMQAKCEPGNIGGVQISPTVQATRSNYLRVHAGTAVAHLRHFHDLEPRRVIADVLQSEHGAWFYRKRNRNMIVETTEDLDPGAGFRWMTLGQLHRLMSVDNLVNMDTRTVLSCLPPAGSPDGPALHPGTELLSWFASRQAQHILDSRLIPLAGVSGWTRATDEIRRDDGGFFKVVGVSVRAGGREVSDWCQPLIEPVGTEVVGLLTRRIDGVRHSLVHARVEAGFRGTVELGGTVQCDPAQHRPPFLDEVLGAPGERILFDTELSEEGGRFYHAGTRYRIVEVPEDFPDGDRPDYRWVTDDQLSGLLRHGNYVNVQARTLVAALRGLR